MTSQVCPVCQASIVTIETRPGQWAAKCPRRIDHAKSTIITGHGPTPDESAADYIAKASANLTRAADLARIRAEKAAGTYVECPRRVGKRAIMHPTVLAGLTAECPSCRVPLAIRETTTKGRHIYVARCPNGMKARNPCEYDNATCTHDTRDGALSAWLFNSEKREMETKLVSGPHCPRCGLRGEHECIMGIEHYARSGKSSGGLEHARTRLDNENVTVPTRRRPMMAGERRA